MSAIDPNRLTAGPLTPEAVDAAPAAPTAADVAKLRTLAAQFESMLLGQMMKEMRNSVFDDGEETGFGSNPLSDTMFSELSLALSRAGGVGLSDSLMGSLGRQAGVSGMPSVQLPGTEVPLEGTVASTINAIAGRVTSSRDDDHEDGAGELSAMSLGDLRQVGGRLSSGYGWRKDPLSGAMKFHKGADIAMPTGKEIPAARAGTVTFAGEMAGYGLTVVVDHGNQVTTRYAHLSEVSVDAGDTVAAGQVLARSGATGRVTGPHLHFEVMEAGQPVDPSRWLGAAARQ